MPLWTFPEGCGAGRTKNRSPRSFRTPRIRRSKTSLPGGNDRAAEPRGGVPAVADARPVVAPVETGGEVGADDKASRPHEGHGLTVHREENLGVEGKQPCDFQTRPAPTLDAGLTRRDAVLGIPERADVQQHWSQVLAPRSWRACCPGSTRRVMHQRTG